MKIKKLLALCITLHLFYTPRGWSQEKPRPSSNEENAEDHWVVRYSPEQASLLEFISFPLGLGYFSQGEIERGTQYAAIELGGLLSGFYFTTLLNGTSPTQLFEPLLFGLWLASIADVGLLARQKNRQMALKHGLSEREWWEQEKPHPAIPFTLPYSQPQISWGTHLNSPMLLQKETDFPLALGPGLGLDIEYQWGTWLSQYLGSEFEQLYLSGNLQFFMPVNQVSANPDFSGTIKNASGLMTHLGLIHKQTGKVWDLRYGLQFGRVFRFAFQGLAFPRATYNGASVLGEIDYHINPKLDFSLRLETGYYFPGSQSEKEALSPLFIINPGIGFKWS